MGRYALWSPTDDDLIREHYHRWRASDLAKLLGRTKNMIIGRAKRLGLAKPRPEINSTSEFLRLMEARHKRRLEMARKRHARRLTAMRRMKMAEDCGDNPVKDAPSPAPAPTIADELMAPPPPRQGVTLLELREHHCRALLGYDTTAMPVYCGLQKDFVSSYCPKHRAQYHVGTPPSRSRVRPRVFVVRTNERVA